MARGIKARFGMGKGTLVDLNRGTAIAELVEWGETAQAGDRLLMTSTTRKEIKRRTKCVKGIAEEYGLALQWRYMREITLVPTYIHPEWVPVPVTEYQAWVLVKARATPEADDITKDIWLVEWAIRLLNKESQEVGKYPAMYQVEAVRSYPPDLDQEKTREEWI